MHNLAIALHRMGYQVTGSDDQIQDPSRSRLDKEGLLPDKMGWSPELITSDIDAIILGMHAREDNPELARAQELGLRIYSYPEYLYEVSKAKKRVVIGGSHGKTSTTAMILHVLQDLGIDADYMVGAQLDGFDCMVRLSDAPVIILEGDEYLSSPIDRRPKFHLYQPHIAVLTGIAWDHINVFPTFENYVEQFRLFAETIDPNGLLIYYQGDVELRKIATQLSIDTVGYGTHAHDIRDGVTTLHDHDARYPLEVFGEHNLQNLSAALEVCLALGCRAEQFYQSISSFGGAARRLELVARYDDMVVYKDFAHSPSKLKATTEAFKSQYPDRELIACMELHTFSSLNKEFLSEYKGSMAQADKAYIYFDPDVVAHKRLDPISKADIATAFNSDNLTVFDDMTELTAALQAQPWKQKNLLLMTSGTFKGMNMLSLAADLHGV